MARRSPKNLNVSQMYDIVCSWRLYRIFHFRERQAKRLVFNRGHSNVHVIENENARRMPDVVTTVDEKYPHTHIDENSKRRRDYGRKSISCVKNDEVAAVQKNEATNMVVVQNFINSKYLCKDGAVPEPHQFFDALQILYSNKELFLKILRDPDSLLVKQIYDLQIPPLKEQNQAGPKMSTRPAYESKWIHSQKSYATQTGKPSLFPFSHIKRKLRHAMGLGHGGDKVIGLESVERNSQSGNHSGFAKGGKSSVDLKKREKMRKMKDFTLCIGQGAVSVGESCGRNMTRTSVSPSEQNIENTHVEATENCRFEEQNINDSNLHLPIGSVKIVQSSHDLHLREIRYMDVPSSQSSEMDVTTEETESVMDSPHEMQDSSFSPEVASSSCSPCQSIDDPHAAEFPVQAVHDKFEKHHVGDLIRSSSDPMNSLITSMDTPESDSIKKILQVVSLKWDELVMKYEPPDQLTDPSTLEELKRLTNQSCDTTNTVFFDYVKEVFTETYQNFIRSLYQYSVINSEVQAYVFKRMMVNEVKEVINLLHCQHQSAKTLSELVEKDLARRWSWLNVEVDAEDIAVEVEEDVLEELILKIVSEIDIRRVMHSYI